MPFAPRVDFSAAFPWVVAITAGMVAGHSVADDVVQAATPLVAKVGILHLRVGDVTLANQPSLLAASDAQWNAETKVPVVVQLRGPMNPTWERMLASTGVVILDYLPTESFLCDLSRVTSAQMKALDCVLNVVSFQTSWKVDPALLAQALLAPAPMWVTEERRALSDAGLTVVGIWMFAGQSDAPVREALRAAGGSITSVEQIVGQTLIGANVSPQAAAELAAIPGVQWIEVIPEMTERSNTFVRAISQSGTATDVPFYDRDLTGQGEIIGIIDSRPNLSHCAFSDPEGDPPGPNHRKVLAYNATTGSSARHGTHVSCTATGDGLHGDSRGVAYGARMVFNTHPLATETSVFERFYIHSVQGASVHSNSWGADGVVSYDGSCRGIDALMYLFEDNLIIHSVSNGSVVYNPENAKNSLAVAAAGSQGSEDSMCIGGAGPTQDGRRKPEITSVGCSVNSASFNSTCGELSLTGTSMAAPGVGGTAILIRQYFSEGFFPSGVRNAADAMTPSGSLLKAMLINGAVDMLYVPGFPNNREGWGRVHADNAAYFAGDSRQLAIRDVRTDSGRALSTGGSHALPIEVTAGQSLKVTLAYADMPGAAGVSVAWVNNLDLEVTDPNGITFKGNVFANSQSATGGEADQINNLEQVLVLAPTPGTWTVRVAGTAVNMGPQGYALVVTGGVQDLSCAADFNFSASVDGDDVIDFFAAWDASESSADIDRSQGIDGDDIVRFFIHWDSGC